MRKFTLDISIIGVISNFIITEMVFALGWRFFPNTVVESSLFEIGFAGFTYWGLRFIMVTMIAIILERLARSRASDRIVFVISMLSLVLIVFGSLGCLYATESIIEEFAVVGLLPKIIVVLLTSASVNKNPF